jgi:adenylate cyclase
MKGQRLLAFLVSVLAALSIGLLASEPSIAGLTGLERVEYLTLDYRQRVTAESLRGAEAGESPVVLVLFDSTAVMDWDYFSPYPRAILAELVDALAGAGARSIGLDVYLDRTFPNLGEGDQQLRDAMERAGNVVLAAMTVEGEEGRVLRPPHPYFTEVAAGVGTADLPTAFDVVREGTLVVRDGATDMVPGLALALYSHSMGVPPQALMEQARVDGRLDLEGLPSRYGEIPGAWLAGQPSTVDRLSFPIRFLGPRSNPEWADAEGVSGTFPAYSSSFAATVALFSPEFFRDKIVLLGTGFHDSDKFRTPFYDAPLPPSLVAEGGAATYGWTFGVEVHANALMNMLDGEYVRTSGAGLLGLVILINALITTGVVFRWGTAWGAGVMLLTMLGHASLAFAAFAGVGAVWGGPYLWLPMISPVLAIVVAYLSATAYVAVVEGREKRFIRGAFGKYVSPDVVAEIAEDPESLKLGGQKRELSILFSDLAGFTDLSESLDPQELLALLNEYLTEMTALVMDEGGTLDKYIGDAIMAFWNAPQDQPDHADRALRCAIRMQRRMDELNARWAAEGKQSDPFVVRIGLNTGTVVVGNVGGEDRFDYSAIGDPVNLAARLEPANKTYDTLTMVSEYLVEQVYEEQYQLRELDLMAVKGKTLPVRVYEVVEEVGVDIPEDRAQALKHYDAGLKAFRDRDWELALRYFEAALQADPTDGPSKVYLKRALEFQASPPAEDWDFVVRRTTK